MKDMKSDAGCPEHLCTVNKSARNQDGQVHTMAGTTGAFNPPHADMSNSKCVVVDPTGSVGVRKFEKQ